MKAQEPGQAVGGAVRHSDTDMKQLFGCIYVDMTFVKSVLGICMVAEIILSLLGLIISNATNIPACDFLYGSSYSYFEFVCGSCFFCSLVWYILNALAVLRKFGLIRWDIGEMIWCAAYVINFLIASAILATHSCNQDSYKAAAAFGFFCLFLIAGHGGWQVKIFLDKRRESPLMQSQALEYDNAAVAEDRK